MDGNNNLNSNGRFVGITQTAKTSLLMRTYGNLWQALCSYENLCEAFRKARKHKTEKPYVQEFARELRENLLQLRMELLLHAYRPAPLKTFILRDPKTRKISKSEFRDRVVHHALCNVIEPLFEKSFIADSYANRKGKGVHSALQRFVSFQRKAGRNHTRSVSVFKADITHYFETVDHDTLLRILKKKIADGDVLWLIRIILDNYTTAAPGKGMPLGNLTSQFFANVYLNELDQFVKHNLKAKYYLRYVDDFVIVEHRHARLQAYQRQITEFLPKLQLTLHPTKSHIRELKRGVGFLGFRIFPHHMIPRQQNIRKMQRRLLAFQQLFSSDPAAYDAIYASMEGWCAYAMHGNTRQLRRKLVQRFEALFPQQISTIELNRWLRIHRSMFAHKHLARSPMYALNEFAKTPL